MIGGLEKWKNKNFEDLGRLHGAALFQKLKKAESVREISLSVFGTATEKYMLMNEKAEVLIDEGGNILVRINDDFVGLEAVI